MLTPTLALLLGLSSPGLADDSSPLPAEGIHLGLGVGLFGSTNAISYTSDGANAPSFSVGLTSGPQLRLRRGFTIAAMLEAAQSASVTAEGEGGLGDSPSERRRSSLATLRLGLQPVLARSDKVELFGLVGLGYGRSRALWEDDAGGTDRVESDTETTDSGLASSQEVPADQQWDQDARRQAFSAVAGVGLQRWFDPTFSLSARLTLGGLSGGRTSLRVESEPDQSTTWSWGVELEPTVALLVHLWL